MTEKRAFLLLQGPPGPMFYKLGQALRERGHEVVRINLGGGDRLDWPNGAINYRGRFSGWPVFIDRVLRKHRITDLLLFGDCRPYHMTAHGIAAERGVRTHVLEEGYLRPNWMTLEPDGVNARSTLSRDKSWFLKEAARLPPEEDDTPITASFKRRARDAYWYYHYTTIGRLRYPHYRSHRPGSIIVEGLGWLWKFTREAKRTREAAEVCALLSPKNYFIFPLQLSGDYQVRSHSFFPDMQSAAAYVIESFANHAPKDLRLVLKRHPLDCSFFSWSDFVAKQAREHNLEGRLLFIDGGDLDQLARDACGMVCVNSTSATLALAEGTPVYAAGEAIYDLEGLTHQGHLDGFWSNPQAPEEGLYEAFRRVLVHRCLIRGGIASESAMQTLITSMLERLEA